MHIGTGFTIPAHLYPLPNLRLWLKTDAKALRHDEDLTLTTINKLLDKLKLAPLDQITDLFVANPQVLSTLKELDPYQERKNGNYYGAWINPIGEKPLWPEGKRKKDIRLSQAISHFALTTIDADQIEGTFYNLY
jgi:hypothetical protein